MSRRSTNVSCPWTTSGAMSCASRRCSYARDRCRATTCSTCRSVPRISTRRPEVIRASSKRSVGLRSDLVQLGLGVDGHTASLVPGDPVLDSVERDVAVSGEYQGSRRMTLTLPALSRARQRLWLVTGAEKAALLRDLIEGTAATPANRIERRGSLVVADLAASPGGQAPMINPS